MISLSFLKPVALFAALVRGYASPGSCSGACNVHDPTLIQRSSDSLYFRFSTGNEISYASSSSIKGPWSSIGSVLPDGSSIDLAGNTDLWVSLDEIHLLFPCTNTFDAYRAWRLMNK